MNVVMIIPTGIGCEIGGHAGDATPAAKLLAACCDKLILHPNVVNASDINEMSSNALYVEGGHLDMFLDGLIELREVTKSNKILLVTNRPAHSETINAASAARATMGAEVEVLELNQDLRMVAIDNGINQASGNVYGWEALCNQVQSYNFDALAIASSIEVDKEWEERYWKEGGINPWGAVEAKASRLISQRIMKPVAHAPVCIGNKQEESDFVCDPRMSAELVSWSFLHCVLKGLHKAPKIIKKSVCLEVEYNKRGIDVEDIDVMISPANCWGRPHIACERACIPIIEVLENQTKLSIQRTLPTIKVNNYWEAAGLLMCIKAGISKESVRRPLEYTKVNIL